MLDTGKEQSKVENEKDGKKLEHLVKVSMRPGRAIQAEAWRSKFESVSLEMNLGRKS